MNHRKLGKISKCVLAGLAGLVLVCRLLSTMSSSTDGGADGCFSFFVHLSVNTKTRRYLISPSIFRSQASH